MRKIVAIENVSVDGVMESPEKWAFQYHDDAINGENQEGMGDTTEMLFGRKTYQEFTQSWGASDASDELGITTYLNGVRKYVVSTTLDSADWNNSVLIKENIEDEIAKLKQTDGGDITIVGSATLVRSLLKARLLDSLILYVHPLVLGEGRLMFPAHSTTMGLKLVDTRSYSKGVVKLEYAPE